MLKIPISTFAAVLMTATLAPAAVVYVGGINTTVPISSTQYLAIDLNGDTSSPRVAFVNINTVDVSKYDLFIGNLGGETVHFTTATGATFGDGLVRRLASGDTVTPYSEGTYEGGDTYLEYENDGEWNNFSGTAFAGLAFYPTTSGADLHHSWVRIAFDDANNTVTLVDFAYEDSLNTGIVAGVIPEPSAFGLAGFGALAVVCRRTRKG